MKIRQKFGFMAILLVLTVYLGVVAVRERLQMRDLVFVDSLELTAVTVDGNPLTLSDMAFYIAFQEMKIEEDARIYDSENTGKYWNLHINKTFIRQKGKQAVMDMAIHDEIFYQLARREGMELSDDEEAYLANSQYDFWSDLTDEQKERLGVGEDILRESMQKIALAEKYQNFLAAMTDLEFEDYEVGGAAYEELLAEHIYAVHEKVWDRLHFGEITFRH